MARVDRWVRALVALGVLSLPSFGLMPLAQAAQDAPVASSVPEDVVAAPATSVADNDVSPRDDADAGVERGRVSWYGSRFTGHQTACGGRFDPKALTMAHPTLPCGTRVVVTNPANHRSVVVVVTDRGPFAAGRIGDLSRAAARKLGVGRRGSLYIEIHRIDH